GVGAEGLGSGVRGFGGHGPMVGAEGRGCDGAASRGKVSGRRVGAKSSWEGARVAGWSGWGRSGATGQDRGSSGPRPHGEGRRVVVGPWGGRVGRGVAGRGSGANGLGAQGGGGSRANGVAAGGSGCGARGGGSGWEESGVGSGANGVAEAEGQV
nr:hypothetical protein [Tanacetum cinerariifolium]